MFKNFKRIIAAVISSAMILTCTGCTLGKNTAYALTVDGYQIKAGIYIYYSYSALNEAKNLAAKQNSNLDTNDEDALKKVKIEGKDFLDYVKDKTTESCINHVAVIRHFDELNLTLSDEETESVSEYVDAIWESNEEMFTKNGIGKDSLKEINDTLAKRNEIFNSYYGEDGSENITESQLKDYYADNNARVKYVDMDLHDADGNELDAAGKKEIEDMANDFLKRAKAAENEEKMLEEFDAFQEEYDKFISDQAAESLEDDDAIEEETTEPTEAADSDETESESADDTSDEEEAEDDSENEDTDSDEESDSDDEEEPAVTSAPENEDSETTTTTTAAPYTNETIVPVVTTDENTKEEDLHYTPSKKCYDWIFNDAKTGVPELIEDDDTLYVIVKLDINQRMNEDDLWTETNSENVRYDMFSDDFDDMVKEWSNVYEVEKNEKAYKKYDPFKFKVD